MIGYWKKCEKLAFNNIHHSMQLSDIETIWENQTVLKHFLFFFKYVFWSKWKINITLVYLLLKMNIENECFWELSNTFHQSVSSFCPRGSGRQRPGETRVQRGRQGSRQCTDQGLLVPVIKHPNKCMLEDGPYHPGPHRALSISIALRWPTCACHVLQAAK